jgi:hypothetical protein
MAEPRTYKTEIILRLFQKRWNAATQQLNDPVVSSVEIRQEHAAYRMRRREPVEVTNVPAFMKDFLRKRSRANANWPPEIFAAGYTARQVTGGGRIFEFVPILPGQTEPFPSTTPTPPPDTIPHKISSVSLPLASMRLGRTDEPWLVQVSVRLHLVETYFALFSARKNTVRQVDHLQNALKLSRTEIDALFLGIEEIAPGKFEEFIITCEAKRIGEDIIEEQVLQQIKAVFKLDHVKQAFAVPIALKSISPSKIHIVEYGEVRREDAEALDVHTMVNQAVFELVPPVPGIGGGTSQRSPKGKKPHRQAR